MNDERAGRGESVDDILSQLHARRAAQAAPIASGEAAVDDILRGLGMEAGPARKPKAEPPRRPSEPRPARQPEHQAPLARPGEAPAARIVNAAPLVKPVVEVQTGTLELPSVQDYSQMQARRGADIQRGAAENALARAAEHPGEEHPRAGSMNWEADDRFRAFFAKSIAQDTPGGRPLNDTGAFDTTTTELPVPRGREKKKGRKKGGVRSFLEKTTQDADERFLTGEFDVPMSRERGAAQPDEAWFESPDAGMQEISFDASEAQPAAQPAAEVPHTTAALRREPASGRPLGKQHDLLGATIQMHGANTALFNTLQVGEPETSSAGTGTFQRFTISMPLTETGGREFAGAYQGEDESDYNHVSDAPTVAASLHNMRLTRILRMCITGLVAALLFYLGIASRMQLLPAIPNLQEAARPLVLLMANLLLLTVASVTCLTTMGGGIAGLFSKRPSVDALPALAVLASVVQIVSYLVKLPLFDPAAVTLFAPIAALGLFVNSIGKWLHSVAVSRSFEIASAGYDHAAAFLVPNRELTRRVCSGLMEPEPLLLVSRPTELVRGFMRQSFSVHVSDRLARKLAWLTLLAGTLCGVLYGLKDGNALAGVTGAAAAICLAAPLASSLVYAIPSLRMQKAAAEVGAVVPGPSAVQNLGLCNTVLLNARDLFPASCVRVRGMKTFNKGRIDLVMLYAASVAYYQCDTLREVFMALVDNKRSVLYSVENPQAEMGFGFSGWIENHEVLLGNRAMMRRHGIAVPSPDYERKYTKDGENSAVYLAVGGRAFGMFLVSYLPDPATQAVLADLENSSISMLIQSDDFNLNAQMIAATYHVSPSFIKVLTQAERELLAGQTEYMEESEGYMTHTGECTSFIGGLRAAATAAASEHLANVLEMIAVLLTLVLCVVLSFARGLADLPLWGVALYLITWCLITILPPALKKG